MCVCVRVRTKKMTVHRLMRACIAGDLETIRLLPATDINIHQKDAYGDPAYRWISGENVDEVKLLFTSHPDWSNEEKRKNSAYVRIGCAYDYEESDPPGYCGCREDKEHENCNAEANFYLENPDCVDE